MNILEKKLIHSFDDNDTKINQIKELYNSFDGSKLTSTLVDIEEMCYCLAQAIRKHITYFLENILPNDPELVATKSILAVRPHTQGDLINLLPSQNNRSFNTVEELKLNIIHHVEDDTNTSGGSLSKKKRNLLDEMDEPNYDPSKLDPIDCIYEENEESEQQNSNLQQINYSCFQSDNTGEDQEESKETDNLCNSEDINPLNSNSNSYKLDFYGRNSLAIISEKTQEYSEKEIRNIALLSLEYNEQNKIIQNEIQTNEEMELFLRESLRESMLTNLKESDFCAKITNREGRYAHGTIHTKTIYDHK